MQARGELAVFVTACVVSVVGLIGFIGLAAPAMVRLLGIRQLGQRLLWGPILGALLLTATDLLLQTLSNVWPVLIPTGAMTALLGAPLLLVFLAIGMVGVIATKGVDLSVGAVAGLASVATAMGIDHTLDESEAQPGARPVFRT